MGKWAGRTQIPIDRGSHRKLLRIALNATTGPVLELGAGEHSTEWLHARCGNRLLMTLDNNAEYLQSFRDKWEHDRHKFDMVKDWHKCKWYTAEMWSVVLLDLAPALDRAVALNELAWNAAFIICHDTDCYEYGWDRTLLKFAYQWTDRTALPFTTIASNLRSIPRAVLEL